MKYIRNINDVIYRGIRTILATSIVAFSSHTALDDLVTKAYAQDLSQTKIVFASERDIGPNLVYDLFIMDSDGSNQINITPNEFGRAVGEWGPTWSPDGRRIAFASERNRTPANIYVINSDGSNMKNLTNNPAGRDINPTWSSDGKNIVFISTRGGAHNIYIMKEDGSNQTLLTPIEVEDESTLTWSPDGNYIMFSDGKDMYTINRSGDNLTRILSNGAKNMYPAWSPLREEITFSSNMNGNYDIYVMDTHGKILRRLTDNPLYDRRPSWSPDGSKIAYAGLIQKRPDMPGGGIPEFRFGDSDIIIMNADGTDKKNLTYDFGDNSDEFPAWSPYLIPTPVSPQGKTPTLWGRLKQSVNY